MNTMNRRYDIDWLRVIAIGLLLIYHVAIGFQSWGLMIGFITNDQSWVALWKPMSMLNVWRIPLLFFVSGMGVYFAMQHRTWKQLLQERATRILLPYVFGTFCIFPISLFILQHYYKWDLNYSYNPGHLWFLGNIFVYVLILSPVFFYFKNNENGKSVRFIKRMFSKPLGLLPVVGVFVLEVLIMKPNPYELYAMTWHGFVLGLLAFFFGFCFALSGDGFSQMVYRWRWFFLVTAIVLYALRMAVFELRVPSYLQGYLLATESDCWIFSAFAFGYKYLNRGGKTLTYLSHAAYPVYIQVKFLLVLLFTLAGCLLTYEFLIRRINVIQPPFGVKMKGAPVQKKESTSVTVPSGLPT
jgi:glucans biosynthesis protein C